MRLRRMQTSQHFSGVREALRRRWGGQGPTMYFGELALRRCIRTSQRMKSVREVLRRRWGGWGRRCTLGSWRCCAASRVPRRWRR